MKNIIKFIIFMIFSILIFFINDLKLLIILFILTIFLSIYLKLELKKLCKSLKCFLPIILFTIVINSIFLNGYEGILLGLRMLICYNITYIFSKTITIIEIFETLQKVLYPLKFLNVDIKNIGIMISISICMIPIFKNEINMAINALNIKGNILSANSIMYAIKPILISVFNKTKEIEKTLLGKAYQEKNI